MGKFLILVLVALALVQLSGATEQEAEKQISLLENQEDLQIQELADPKRRKKNKAGKKKKGNKGGKRKRKAKQARRKAKKGKRNGKGKRNNKKSGRKARRGKQGKKGKKIKVNARRNQNREAGCEAGCSELLVGMMKAARKQNTYLKQFNRIVNGQKQAAKKGLKKDNFNSNATDGPLNLLITAGGGNKSELTCAGSKTNKAALLMANLTAKLDACETDLGTKCNTSAFSVIKPEWSACNSSMLAFKAASDECMKLSGAGVCTCFNATATVALQKKVENCSGTEMAAASASDGKLKKACIKTYGACRQGGESIRPVLAACQPGGATEDEMKKSLGDVLKNEAATSAVTDKIDATIAAASGRKTNQVKRAISLGGVDYETNTCALWTAVVTAFLDAILKSASTDVSAAGTEIVAVVVTCTSADLSGLQAAKSKGAEAKSKIAKKKAMLKKNIENVSGAPVSETELASLAAATTAAPAGAVTKAVRRRNKILAEFRQRL